MTERVIAIGICTFRRAALVRTLESIEAQAVPHDATLLVIVADNDDDPTAAGMVGNFAARSAHGVEYVHAPARNISVARNAILDSAKRAGADRLAFIDDDEAAAPDWIIKLDARLGAGDADAVMGPVRAIYRADAPEWMQADRVHDTWPEIGPDGQPVAGHSCNAMIDLAAPAFSGLRFDPMRGRTGGEDSAWFEAARRAGARFAFADDALVTEKVPVARERLRWLMLRRYRMGQTYGDLHYSHLPTVTRIGQFILSFAKAGWCMAVAALRFPSRRARSGNIVRAAFHTGVMSHMTGRQQPTLYGTSDRSQDKIVPMTGNVSRGREKHE